MYKVHDLIEAIQKNNQEGVKTIIAEDGSLVNATSQYGDTALIWAAYKGYTEIVKSLLEKDADVNAKDNNGHTALIWAVVNGHTEIVKSLLANNADFNAKNQSGHTALDYAKEKGHTGIVALLQAYKVKADLTYKHSDGYILSKLKEIYSKFPDQVQDTDSKPADQVQDANSKTKDRKTQFTTGLLEALKDDSFAIYRLYNLDFGKDETLKTSIHDFLQEKYNELSSIEKFFYAIWHFLEEYVIFPILGEKDEVQLSVRDTELKTSNTMGEVSNDRNDGIE